MRTFNFRFEKQLINLIFFFFSRTCLKRTFSRTFNFPFNFHRALQPSSDRTKTFWTSAVHGSDRRYPSMQRILGRRSPSGIWARIPCGPFLGSSCRSGRPRTRLPWLESLDSATLLASLTRSHDPLRLLTCLDVTTIQRSSVLFAFYMLIFAARQESDTPCGHLKNFKILLNHFGRGLRKNAQDEFASSRIPQHWMTAGCYCKMFSRSIHQCIWYRMQVSWLFTVFRAFSNIERADCILSL